MLCFSYSRFDKTVFVVVTSKMLNLVILGTHFDVDLMHRKAEVKAIITDVINNMSDDEDEGEEAESGDDDVKDEDGDNDA